MIWFKKHEPEAATEREQALFELYEKNIKMVNIDIQEDIANINRQLNELRRYIDAVALKMETLHERNTDAMELKDTLLKLIQMARRVHTHEPEDEE